MTNAITLFEILKGRFGEEAAIAVVKEFEKSEAAAESKIEKAFEAKKEVLATKADIAIVKNDIVEVKSDLKGEIYALREDLSKMDGNLRTDMAKMEGRILTKMEVMNGLLLEKIAGSRSEIIKWMFIFWIGMVAMNFLTHYIK
jgi:hypothetical protein